MSALQKIDFREYDISERDVVELLNDKFDRLHKENREMKALLKTKEKEISGLHLALDASRDQINGFSEFIGTSKNEYSDLLKRYREQGIWVDWYLALTQGGLMFMLFCGAASVIGTFFL